MLQQRGVLPGGKPGGGGESSRSSSCASSPTTPSDAAGGVQFWSDSDMEEQSAALVLTTGDAQLSEEFGKMSLKPGAAS